MLEMQNHSRSAPVPVNYEATRERLQNDRYWGAEILDAAGEYGWRVKMARRYSRGHNISKIIVEGPDQFIAWGVIGQKSFLAYRVEREMDGSIRVTPLA